MRKDAGQLAPKYTHSDQQIRQRRQANQTLACGDLTWPRGHGGGQRSLQVLSGA